MAGVMIEIDQDRRMILQIKGEDSPCIKCPISIHLRVQAIREVGHSLKEIDQYCGFDKWREKIMEAHQTTIFEKENGEYDKIDNQTHTGPQPKGCPLT